MNPVAIRLLNQQLIVPQFSDPAEVVSYMGAMQAQEYRMMRWAVEMRTRKPSACHIRGLCLVVRLERQRLSQGNCALGRFHPR